MSVSFEPVTTSPEHIQSLYDLLSLRVHSISHQCLPDFEEHAAFVRDHPYRVWAFVLWDDVVIGNFYLQDDNSLGINLVPEAEHHTSIVLQRIISCYEPLPAQKSVRRGEFVINVAPGNLNLKGILEDQGCPALQTTYALTPRPSE